MLHPIWSSAMTCLMLCGWDTVIRALSFFLWVMNLGTKYSSWSHLLFPFSLTAESHSGGQVNSLAVILWHKCSHSNHLMLIEPIYLHKQKQKAYFSIEAANLTHKGRFIPTRVQNPRWQELCLVTTLSPVLGIYRCSMTVNSFLQQLLTEHLLKREVWVILGIEEIKTSVSRRIFQPLVRELS